MDNSKGATTAFATFSPYTDRRWRWYSWASLVGAWTQTKTARGPEFLHTAQFLRLTPAHLERIGIKHKALSSGGLIFFSAYNGDPEVYFRGFSDELFVAMDAVWRACRDWEAAKPFEKLDTFIRRYRRPVGSFFNAYPDTAKRIRSMLVLRRQIDKLTALASTAAATPNQTALVDARFAVALERVVHTHWSNIRATREDL